MLSRGRDLNEEGRPFPREACVGCCVPDSGGWESGEADLEIPVTRGEVKGEGVGAGEGKVGVGGIGDIHSAIGSRDNA